jgi:alanine-synthesizing transaminase
MSENIDIKLSERMYRLPPYIFGELNALKLKRRQEGVDIIDLGMGNPDKPSLDNVVDKLKEAIIDPKTHRYSRSRGLPQLLKAMAAKYENLFGVTLDPDKELIATIGSKEGVSHLALAMLGPGNSAIVPSPAFPIHIWSVIIAGANVITTEIGDITTFIPRMAHLIENLWPKPKMLYLNFPHNPTTTVVDLAFFEEVVAYCKKHEIVVVNDFAYSDITFDGYKAPSILQVKGAKDIAVEFTTMSKSYNMAGWRVGFCAGNKQIIDALARLKGYYDYGIFTPVQVASIIALREPFERLEEIASVYQERRDILVEGLNKGGWNIVKPKATMFVWAPIPDKYAHMGSEKFARLLLEEAEVCITPGISFGDSVDKFVRIALVENENRLKQAVKQINKTLKLT